MRSEQGDDSGFTLIELLVVIIIIGILSAIAVPIFMKQRSRATEAAMKSDLRVVAGRMETYYVDYFNYPTDLTPFAGDIAITSGNTVTVESAGAAFGSFCLKVTNPAGVADVYYDSDRGGIQARGVPCV